MNHTIAILRNTYWRKRSWAMWLAAFIGTVPYAVAQPLTLFITVPGWLLFVPACIWLIDNRA